MGKGEGRGLAVREQPPVAGGKPVIHGVGGGHGGQGHVEPAGTTSRQQAMGEDQRRLGLAAAGHVLDNRDEWACGQLN